MPHEWTGRELGGYHVIEWIGSGNMAEVYKAMQPSVNRAVAIKIMSAALAGDTEFVKRFQQEAKVVARLEYPNILPVIDYGEEEQALYLVMRYLKGGTLHDLIQAGPLPPQVVLRYLTEIGQAIDYAHGLDIVHRDIKPRNVLLDLDGNPFIADFGLAKITSAAALTLSGQIMGTPRYISPERALGRPVDGRSDLYSLGVILYEMLTGHVPYDADSTVDLVMQHIESPIPSVTAANPQLPPAFDDILNRALAKDPADRYPTAGELSQAVAQALNVPLPSEALLPELHRAPGARPGLGFSARRWFRNGGRWARDRLLPLRDTASAFLREKQRETLTVGGTVALTLVVFVLMAMTNKAPVPATPAPVATVAPTLTAIATATLPPTKAAATQTPSDETKLFWDKDGMTLLYVPAGKFPLGSGENDSEASEDEKPPLVVYLDAYWIDQTEVTVAQFQDFVTDTNYQTDAERGCCEGKYAKPGGNVFAPWAYFVKDAYWKSPEGRSAPEALPRRPVVQVSWNDAVAYCKWVGRRLPTEAEWDKAARGPQGLIYPWGDEFNGHWINFCDKRCGANWHDRTVEDGFERTSNVGEFLKGASGYGLLDMSGNAREWVYDFYDFRGYYRYPTENPTGPETGETHVMRGGSWLDPADRVRASAREADFPDSRNDAVGFRCAMSAEK
jgi:formylglycine-generating enzyme required for sulfatase activity/serine/threonine protein kinase